MSRFAAAKHASALARPGTSKATSRTFSEGLSMEPDASRRELFIYSRTRHLAAGQNATITKTHRSNSTTDLGCDHTAIRSVEILSHETVTGRLLTRQGLLALARPWQRKFGCLRRWAEVLGSHSQVEKELPVLTRARQTRRRQGREI